MTQEVNDETEHNVDHEWQPGGQGRCDGHQDHHLPEAQKDRHRVGDRIREPQPGALGDYPPRGCRHRRLERRRERPPRLEGHLIDHLVRGRRRQFERVGSVVDRVELAHYPQGVVQVPADDQRQRHARHQDAQELADQELAAIDGLAHQRNGSAALDFFADRHARRQHAEQDRCQHHHVEADLLHHLVVVPEREVGDDDGEPGDGDGTDDDEPEHGLPPPFPVSGLGHRPALRPDSHEQTGHHEQQVDEQLEVQSGSVDVLAVALEVGGIALVGDEHGHEHAGHHQATHHVSERGAAASRPLEALRVDCPQPRKGGGKLDGGQYQPRHQQHRFRLQPGKHLASPVEQEGQDRWAVPTLQQLTSSGGRRFGPVVRWNAPAQLVPQRLIVGPAGYLDQLELNGRPPHRDLEQHQSPARH